MDSRYHASGSPPSFYRFLHCSETLNYFQVFLELIPIKWSAEKEKNPAPGQNSSISP
ncbi:hypothetical protein HOLDEFILI_03204 [Holdemania filiformis DSM 12042]|uniref:Uncharacterized protein n=1 Tax=Holdemania filiformis DSM 12042 TaxID=545696 RepID=B9YBJ7_9FIRM|nr:hypothetical protein HOLDEFILI_03204 [Holdemania filiformis DSM 12042]